MGSLPVMWKFVVIISQQNKVVGKLAETSLKDLAISSGKALEAKFQAISTLVETFSSDDTTKNYYEDMASGSDDSYSYAYLLERMKNAVSSTAGIVDFAVGYDNGTLVRAGGKTSENATMMNEYKLALADPNCVIITDVYEMGGKNYTSVAKTIISKAIKNSYGNVIGVVWAVVSVDEIKEEVFKEFMQDPSKMFIVVHSSGKTLIHKDSSQEGKDNSSESWYKSLSSSNQSYMVEKYKINGESAYTGFYKTRLGWFVGYGMLEKYLYADVRSLARFLLILIAIVLVTAVVITTYIAKTYFLRPIKIMSDALSKVEQGDLTVEIEYNVDDELGLQVKNLSKIIKNFANYLRSINNEAQNVLASSEESRGQVESLADVVDNNAKTVTEINGAVQNTSASIEETTSSVEEVTASSVNVAQSAQKLSEMSMSVLEMSKEGTEIVKNIAQVVKEAEKKSEVTTSTVDDLAERADKIGEIVEAINSIAEQTNLLALNAAIEAARAGEAGRGFAVVADEIRKLAEESKQATSRIGEILRGIQEGSGKAKIATEETTKIILEVAKGSELITKKFAEIDKNIQNVAQMVQGLAASSQETSAAAEEITSAMDMAAKMVVDIAKNMEDVTKNMTEVASATKSFREEVKVLTDISSRLVEGLKAFKF